MIKGKNFAQKKIPKNQKNLGKTVVYLDCWLDKLGEGFLRQHLIISY